jgi:predicted nucleotide-binding protein
MSDDKPLRCFLSFPSVSELEDVRKVITDTLLDSGIEPILPGGVPPAGVTVVKGVQLAIAKADFLIADLTGNNPNVMYEVGFAHASRKPVVLIIQHAMHRVPSDLAGFIYYVYDPTNLDHFRGLVRTIIQELWPSKRRSKSRPQNKTRMRQ